MDGLYKDIYISRPDNRFNIDNIVDNLDNVIDKLIKELIDCDCSWKTINEFIFEKERILTRLQEIEIEIQMIDKYYN